jgi:hypothetical protein
MLNITKLCVFKNTLIDRMTVLLKGMIKNIQLKNHSFRHWQ